MPLDICAVPALPTTATESSILTDEAPPVEICFYYMWGIVIGIRIGSKYGDAQFSNVDYLELAVIKSNIPAAELLKIFNAFRTKAGV